MSTSNQNQTAKKETTRIGKVFSHLIKTKVNGLEDLADKLHVSISSIKRYQKGTSPFPSQLIDSLCTEFPEINKDYLLGKSEIMTTDISQFLENFDKLFSDWKTEPQYYWDTISQQIKRAELLHVSLNPALYNFLIKYNRLRLLDENNDIKNIVAEKNALIQQIEKEESSIASQEYVLLPVEVLSKITTSDEISQKNYDSIINVDTSRTINLRKK